MVGVDTGFLATPGGGCLCSPVGDGDDSGRNVCNEGDEGDGVMLNSPRHDFDLECTVGEGDNGDVEETEPEKDFLRGCISAGLNTLRNVGTAAGANGVKATRINIMI